MILLIQIKRHAEVKLMFAIMLLLTIIIIILFSLRNETKTGSPELNLSAKVTSDRIFRANKHSFHLSPLVDRPPGITSSHYPTGNSHVGFLSDAEDLKNNFLKEQRELIADEMNRYPIGMLNASSVGVSSQLDNLILEKGGHPMRNVVFATWRSGSTFIGDLLNSHPATFYHYEPLLHMGVKQVRSKMDAKAATTILGQLLTCNYTGIEEFNLWQRLKSPERNQHNKRIWKFCKRQRKVCDDPMFIANMCALFPFQSMKTVRMRLKYGKFLLEKKQFNARLLLLVRDPRAIMQSRQHRDWCFNGPDCIAPKNLCADMEEDFKYANRFRLQYPGKFLALRYEDISLHPFAATKKIFKFYGMHFHEDVKYFLQTHTVTDYGGVTSTYRNSAKTAFHWAREIYEQKSYSYLKTVQSNCLKVMENWGYAPVSKLSELLQSFNQLKKPPWPEMIVDN